MITFPNFLSFLRIPLAFLFLFSDPMIRLVAVILAALTDFFDGYLARRFNMCSRVGTTLDPMADKFFVFFALATFFQEKSITTWEAISMLCRDFAVILFGLYLILMRQWDNYKFKAIWCGKITTTLQLLVLLLLTLNYQIPQEVYFLFIVLGVLALGELYVENERLKSQWSKPNGPNTR